MKKWKYEHYNEELELVPKDKEYKEPYIWSTEQPIGGYEDITTKSNLIDYESKKYLKRKEDGQKFSDIMNAELVLMNVTEFSETEITELKTEFSIDEDGIVDLAKDEIDSTFEKTQWFLEGGKWKSAQREIKKVVASTFVRQGLIDRIKLSIDSYVNQSYV